MKHKVILAALTLGLAACSSGDADKDKDGKVSKEEAQQEMASGGEIYMQPGEYEIKVSLDSVEAPGLPSGLADKIADQIKAEITKSSIGKSCMTKEELENPGAEFFGQGAGDQCEMKKLDRSGDNINAEMSCKLPGGMSMAATMQGTFGGTSYSMDMTQMIKAGPVGEINVKGKVDGTRVGDCPA